VYRNIPHAIQESNQGSSTAVISIIEHTGSSSATFPKVTTDGFDANGAYI
jgi:hypothetical protein